MVPVFLKGRGFMPHHRRVRPINKVLQILTSSPGAHA